MPKDPIIFLKKLLIEPTSHGFVQFFRYGIVAIIAFAFDFGLLYVFTDYLHWFYLLSATSAFVISVVINYMLSTAWVFAQRTKRERTTELILFIGICLVALFLNDVFMWLFTSVLGIYYITSKIMTVFIVFFLEFRCAASGVSRRIFAARLG